MRRGRGNRCCIGSNGMCTFTHAPVLLCAEMTTSGDVAHPHPEIEFVYFAFDALKSNGYLRACVTQFTETCDCRLAARTVQPEVGKI